MIAWLFVVGAVFGLLFGRMWRHLTHWRRIGVPGPMPVPLFGNINPWTTSTSKLYFDTYDKYSGAPYCGIYEFCKRRLIIRNPALVHRLLIRDFQYFTDRSEINADPLGNGLFTMNGLKWRGLRAKLSPAFTTGKLKAMFPQMVDCAEATAARLGGESDVRLMSRNLATEVIATCVFGMDLKRTEPAVSAQFKIMTSKVITMSYVRSIGYVFLSNWPWLASRLGISFLSKDVLRYFKGVFFETLAQRRSSGDTRNDLVQLLIQLAEKGLIEYTPECREPEDEYLRLDDRPQMETIDINDDLLMAQALALLSAGTETVTNTLMFTLHELAKKVELQQEVRGEIQAAMERNGGLTYQAVSELKLLEMCLQETLRMYPAAKQLFRICTANYVLDSRVQLKAGECLVIPLSGLHMDPAYFPEPHVYNPERFREPPMPGTFLPFGDGPRICLGMRFGLVEMKVSLASILHRFSLSLGPRGRCNIELNKWSSFTAPIHPVYIDFKDIHLKNCEFCNAGQPTAE